MTQASVDSGTIIWASFHLLAMRELLERARRFLREAEDDVRKEFFDLAAFHLEQALQLLLKYRLSEKVGYFSKTHSLSALVEEIGEIEPELSRFLGENRRFVRELERAYIGARYLPFQYGREEVEELLGFVRRVFEGWG